MSDRLRQAWSHYLWLKQTAEAAGKLPPSTAPCHPQPGKRFRIIRIETTPPQPGLLQTGFDTTTSAFGGFEIGTAISQGAPDRSGDASSGQMGIANKKRWSIFGKMLNFSSAVAPGGGPMMIEPPRRVSSANADLDSARRALAAERSGPAPPSKGSPSRESDASSTGSAPVYDAAQYIFKFALGVLPWLPNNMDMHAANTMHSSLPRERPLTRPRLPAPAQARVSARTASAGSRSDSLPPPPPLGLPPPERVYSCTAQTGLISEARNAAPLVADPDLDPSDEGPGLKGPILSLPEIQRVTSLESPEDKETESPATMHSANEDWLEMPMRGRPPIERQMAQPLQPVGVFKERATYSGRALAEWSIVVHECNSFIDRRRDEGVCGLRDVEVPSLGVENLRRMG